MKIHKWRPLIHNTKKQRKSERDYYHEQFEIHQYNKNTIGREDRAHL